MQITDEMVKEAERLFSKNKSTTPNSEKSVSSEKKLSSSNWSGITNEMLQEVERIKEKRAVFKNDQKIKKQIEGIQTEEPTFLGNTVDRSINRLSDIYGRVKEEVTSSPLPMSLFFVQDFIPGLQQFKGGKGTTPASVAAQVAAEPIALTFDVIGSTIIAGAEKGLSYVGDEAKQPIVDFFSKQMETKTGQMAVNALSAGAEKWEEFSRLYPNDAANWTAMFELAGAVPTKAFKTVTNKDLVFTPAVIDETKIPDINVSEVKKLALGRTVDKPLAGQDKFLWNVAFNDPEKGGRTLEQAKTVTEPKFPTYKKHQLATEEEIEIVDILKNAKLKVNQTHQAKYNKIQTYMDDLEQKVINAAKTHGGYDKSKIREYIGNAFLNKIKTTTDKKALAALKEAEDLMSSFFRTLDLDDEFPDTLDGLIAARKYWEKSNPIDTNNFSVKQLATHAIRQGIVDLTEELIPEIIPDQRKLHLLLKEGRSGQSVHDMLLTKAGREKDKWTHRSLWELGNRRIFMSGTGALTKIQDFLVSSAMIPVGVVHNGLKEAVAMTKGLEGVAAIEYAKREMKKNLMEEIAKAAPKTRKEWLQDGGKAVVFGVIDQSAKALQQEYKEEQKNKEKEKLKSKLGKKSTDQEQEIITQPTQTRTFNNSGFIQPGMTDPSTLTNQSVSF